MFVDIKNVKKIVGMSFLISVITLTKFQLLEVKE